MSIAQAILKNRTGLDFTPAEVLRHGKLIKLLVGIDGFSSEEQKHMELRMGQLGFPEELTKEILAFDIGSTTLEKALEGIERGGSQAKALLYAAIAIGSVDGYSDKERTVVAKAAQQLAIDTKIVASIERLVELERAAENLRRAVLT